MKQVNIDKLKSSLNELNKLITNYENTRTELLNAFKSAGVKAELYLTTEPDTLSGSTPPPLGASSTKTGKSKHTKRAHYKCKKWTKADDDMLKELSKEYNCREIGDLMGRTTSSVNSRLWNLTYNPEDKA